MYRPSNRGQGHLWPFLLAAVISMGVHAASALPRSAPEAQGVSSSAVSEFVAALDAEISHVHGLMVLRNGHVIAEGWWEPYRPEYVHLLHSLSKSFTSTAIGLAVEEGILSLDDTVFSFFPDQVPDDASWNQENMRIRDLLTMSTGQHGEDLRTLPVQTGGPIVEPFLALPVAHKPGTYFLYNTPATYMCSAILQKVTGEKLVDYLRPRLFEPLGVGEAHWAESAEGITVGGWGLSVTTESIARFGQLYLQEGRWEGEQLISADWVRSATGRQVSTGSDPKGDWDQGYGFQFWRSRHDSYRGDGAFGQFALVLPEQNSVVAINSGTANMQGILNIVWDRLLPAFEAAPLPSNPEAEHRLRAQLEGLRIPIPRSDAFAEGRKRWLGRDWSGYSGEGGPQHYGFEENPLGLKTLSLFREGENSVLYLSTSSDFDRIRASPLEWVAGETTLDLGVPMLAGGRERHRIAASEAWTGENSVSIRIAYTEAPVMTNLGLHFEDNGVTVQVTHDATFGTTELPSIIGQAIDW